MIFTLFGWLSIIAIVALCLAHLIIFLITSTDKIPGTWKWIPYLVLPCCYILMRLLFVFFPVDGDKTLSLAVMLVGTAGSVIALLYYKTNTFKTDKPMKHTEVADGPKRIIKK